MNDDENVDRRPNIVIVAVDTLRPDHLGCYGYPIATSPAIDALAAESVVFDQAYAAGIPTTPSFTTLLSGLHPYQHRVVTHPAQVHLDEDIQLLPQLAKESGYVTVALDNLVVQGLGKGTWFARGYDHYSGFLYKPFGDQSTQLTDRALEFAIKPRDKPLLLFIHYWDPHTPYGPLPPYDEMHYRPGEMPPGPQGMPAVDMAQVRAIHPDYYEAFLADMNLRHPDDYAYVLAQYDGEISQVDHQIGRLINGLKAHQSWDNTLLLLVSDHGECFGEGGLYFDHHGLYDAVTRLAMILKLPAGDRSGPGQGRVDGMVSHEDVLPTLCELSGIPRPAYDLTGRSMVPLINGSASEIRSSVVSVESTRQASAALRTTTEKVIVPYAADAAGLPLPDLYGRPRDPAPRLFDLRDDPAERCDQALRRPADLARMSAELDRRRSSLLAGRTDPVPEQGLGLPYDFFMHRRGRTATRR
ncbi:sulfatase [Actinopolymorpha sp. B9G3]|uniref:sulfatase family protein n=1 Tax=Actinopolymorpha sp. B9G3 TaxID=3158970 RepID=UPI0032D8D9A1